MQMKERGLSPRVIRTEIDTKYAKHIEYATPTPYPPI
jgi:hypothetical protein